MKTRCKILIVDGKEVHNVSLVYNTLNNILLAFDEVCIIHQGSILSGTPGNLARDWALCKGQPSLQTGGLAEENTFDWIKPDLVLSFNKDSDMIAQAKLRGIWVKEVR